MPTAATEAPKTSLFEDCIDIFHAPSKVFARRENGSFGPALAIITVASLVLVLATKSVLSPIYDAMAAKQMQEAMAKNPQLTPEMMQQGQAVAGVIQTVVVGIATPITILLVGIVLWLVGKLFDSQATLRSALVVSTFAFVPRLLEWVVNAVQAAMMDPSRLTSLAAISLGPARFLDPTTTSPVLLTFALRLSLFIIWATILLAIGLRVTGKIGMRKAALAAFMVWLLGAIPGYFQAMQM
jgi:hypothetical protein